MKTELKRGMSIWLPCEVRGGPFPDERIAYVKSTRGEWFGFVNVAELKEGVISGKDRVRGVVLALRSDHIVVGIEGQSPTTSKSIHADPSSIEYGAVQARNNHPT